jgi:hypothetical protein
MQQGKPIAFISSALG